MPVFVVSQDRYVKSDGTDLEPVVDPSQDYMLISGHENATHTVLRFRRKLDTCDTSYDVPITVSDEHAAAIHSTTYTSNSNTTAHSLADTCTYLQHAFGNI